MKSNPLGRTGLQVPPIIFGTSCLGNLYEAPTYDTKLATVREMQRSVSPPIVLDSAGKYGAGLALETIGRTLRDLSIAPENVMISNKLGWFRVPLQTTEPTFEPGAWVGLEHDAEQRISYQGILDCYEQGNMLLGAPYDARVVSVHDPDEYLAAAVDDDDRQARWQDVLDAYRALFELKDAGRVDAVGVGAKDWTVIRALTEQVSLDWVMLACSLTVYVHPPELLTWLRALAASGVGVINSAVFNAGFLIGGQYFDYRIPEPTNPADQALFAWRDRFLSRCKEYELSPPAVCVQFGLERPEVAAVALNTSKPSRIADNCELVSASVPDAFWQALLDDGLIAGDALPSK